MNLYCYLFAVQCNTTLPITEFTLIYHYYADFVASYLQLKNIFLKYFIERNFIFIFYFQDFLQLAIMRVFIIMFLYFSFRQWVQKLFVQYLTIHLCQIYEVHALPSNAA